MNVAATLYAHGFVPNVPNPQQEAGTPQALVASRVPNIPEVPAEKSSDAAQVPKRESSDPAARVDTRSALLALADRLGVDRAAVARIPFADLPLWAAVPADALLAYLRGLAAMQSASTVAEVSAWT